MRSRRIRAWLAATAVTGKALLMPAASQAKKGGGAGSQCPQGWFCMWQDAYYNFNSGGGRYWAWYPGMPGYNDRYNTWFYVGNSANDQASSVWNRTSHAVYISEYWPPRSGARATLCIQSGVSVSQFPGDFGVFEPHYANGDPTNDSVSAVALMSYDPSPCMGPQ